MDRTQLVAEARAAGERAVHNLQVIRQNPEVMLPGKIEDASAYLNNMIRIAELEMKNDRRPGQSSLSTRLKYLVASILTLDRQKRKEGAA
ncbi:hypothetical protein SAMN04487895_104272 [Paenibacillus sophorae]|uniref:Uncharacterized protein n=1 Tax=Paenibacillus sophorae TaxID=1333845 RepID=A0A1H8LBZ0_9BACL|nr:hypothetical protein [Paenibacillus sophorae]QWU17344.1 hypothetical protein KP014_09430 [Paenibacillus sophorae]SEO02637.1 hypothetical protein SAMN04487895_104272 [Paenibacillus sophorae]